ncbi:MAG: lysophospholipid acyltransferase family protein [Ilumatobacteraceae bacterium]
MSSTATSARRDGERLYRVVNAVATPVYRALWRVRVDGRHHVPANGGAIVAANHVSFFDSVALLQSIPRRAYFIGKAEYMHSWTTRHLFPAMGLIPIEREQARKAMAALEVAADVLRRGDVLGIYPEGTRSRDGLLHKGHTGVAQLALMAESPIVPVGIVGTEHVQPIGARVPRPFRRAVVRFGAPLDPRAYGGSARRRRQLLTDDLMEAIRQLSGQPVSANFASDEPPLVRGGNESVYRVHSVGGVGATWGQAARFAVGSVSRQFDDGRVARVKRLGCRLDPDGAVRFATELDVSVKFAPGGMR